MCVANSISRARRTHQDHRDSNLFERSATQPTAPRRQEIDRRRAFEQPALACLMTLSDATLALTPYPTLVGPPRDLMLHYRFRWADPSLPERLARAVGTVWNRAEKKTPAPSRFPMRRPQGGRAQKLGHAAVRDKLRCKPNTSVGTSADASTPRTDLGYDFQFIFHDPLVT